MAKNIDVTIRPIRNEDIPSVERIAVRAWTPYYALRRATLGDELFELAHPNWEESKASEVRRGCQGDHGCHAYVATIDEKVVGFVTFYVIKENGLAEIGNNAVDPAYQGHGIGTRLYDFVFERMREMGMTHARVRTGGDPAHAPARRAYEKAGFGQVLPHVEYHRKL